MQLSDAFKPDAFKPVEFVASAPQHLLRPKPASGFGPVSSVLTTGHRTQLSTIGTTAGSAFSPSGIIGEPRHQRLADRLANIIPCKPDEDAEEDPEIACVFALLSLSTSPASGRTHQRSAPLLERTLEPTERRVILKAKSRRWRHGQSTPGRKRLSSCPGSISPTGYGQGKIEALPFPMHGVTDSAPSAKRPCSAHVYHCESQARTPYNSPSLEKGVRQATPFVVPTSNFLITEAGIKLGQVLTMDL